MKIDLQHKPLQLSFMLSILLLSLAFLIYSVTIWQQVEEDQNNDLGFTNRLFAQSTVAIFAQYKTLLTTVGLRLIEQGADLDPSQVAAHQYIDRVHRLNPGMGGFGLARLDGQLLLVSGIPAGEALPNLMDSPVTARSFRLTLENQNLMTGRPYYMQQLAQWVIPIRMPLYDETGQLVAVMAAGIGIDSDQTPLNVFDLESNVRVMLISEDFSIRYIAPLNRSDYNREYSSKISNSLHNALSAVTQGGPASTVVEIQGVKYNAFIRELSDFGLFSVTLKPVHLITDEWLDRMKWPLLLFSFFITAAILSFYCSLILHRKSLEEKIRAEAEVIKLSAVVEQNPSAVLLLDEQFYIQYMNAKAVEIFADKSREQLYLQNFCSLPLGDMLEPESILLSLQNEDQCSYELNLNVPVDHWYQVEISKMKDPVNQGNLLITVIEDITERKQAEQELSYLANYDSLTGLPNRTQAFSQLDNLISESSISTPAILIYIDVDNFKQYNDTYGHHFGDQLIRVIGRQLQSWLTTRAEVYHLSADEFVIMFKNEHKLSVTAMVAEIKDRLATQIQVADRQVHVSVSMGVVRYPQDAVDSKSLMRAVDNALFCAKQESFGKIVFFNTLLASKMDRKRDIEQAIKTSDIEQQLVVFYQTKHRVSDQQAVSCEALLRWNHPVYGSVSPAEFIPIAESSDVILRLGGFVLEQACSDMMLLEQETGVELVVSVNVSVRQLRPAFIDEVRGALAQSGLPASRLELEVTESMLAQNMEDAHRILQQLVSLGVTLSIDDFGTGYSSMRYLSRFPLSSLKIDRCFVADMSNSEEADLVIRGIVALGHSLGLTIIAEGVETTEQLNHLSLIGCDLIQGYLLARPEPFELLLEVLKARDCQGFR